MEAENIKAAERERIGQEIHDGAIQAIYSASLILESITPNLKDNQEGAVGLDRAKRVLGTVVVDLRHYMISLRTDVPEETLLVGLRRLVTDPRFSSLLRIQLKCEVEPEFNPIQIGHLLAIVQESLSNIVRHAAARHATVILCEDSGNVILQVVDDGQGFCEDEITPGFGLRAVKDRARLVGGKLSIDSRLGKGTTITLAIPEENGL
jgi:signal transduction histidine kinase